MGHSCKRLPQEVQVTMWPHSSKTQSMIASMQILHSSFSLSAPPLPSAASSNKRLKTIARRFRYPVTVKTTTQPPYTVIVIKETYTIRFSLYALEQNCLKYFYRPQTKLRKGNVFYTCLFTGGGGGGSAMAPWAHNHPQQDQTPPDQTRPRMEHGTRQEVTSFPYNHKSGRFASYWNAFLFFIVSLERTHILSHRTKIFLAYFKM